MGEREGEGRETADLRGVCDVCGRLQRSKHEADSCATILISSWMMPPSLSRSLALSLPCSVSRSLALLLSHLLARQDKARGAGAGAGVADDGPSCSRLLSCLLSRPPLPCRSISFLGACSWVAFITSLVPMGLHPLLVCVCARARMCACVRACVRAWLLCVKNLVGGFSSLLRRCRRACFITAHARTHAYTLGKH